MRIAPRQVCIAGFTPSPYTDWMKQVTRNVTMAEEGFLNGCRYLLHERDAKFGVPFDEILHCMGIEPIVLPPQQGSSAAKDLAAC